MTQWRVNWFQLVLIDISYSGMSELLVNPSAKLFRLILMILTPLTGASLTLIMLHQAQMI